jgi:hypothetical protein
MEEVGEETGVYISFNNPRTTAEDRKIFGDFTLKWCDIEYATVDSKTGLWFVNVSIRESGETIDHVPHYLITTETFDDKIKRPIYYAITSIFTDNTYKPKIIKNKVKDDGYTQTISQLDGTGLFDSSESDSYDGFDGINNNDNNNNNSNNNNSDEDDGSGSGADDDDSDGSSNSVLVETLRNFRYSGEYDKFGINHKV